MKANTHDLGAICFLFAGLIVLNFIREMSLWILIPSSLLFGCALAGVGLLYYEYLSKHARDRKKRIAAISEIPIQLKTEAKDAVQMGLDLDLHIPVFLPDSIRSRHVHVLGATGSGKTESVILNFLKQDIARGFGAVIVDAKGDGSFIRELKSVVPKEKLKIFDLGSASSLSYDPFSSGSALEAGQRLFASLTWSEEYYKSKAFSALQKIFQFYFSRHGRNPTISIVLDYLTDFENYKGLTPVSEDALPALKKEFDELSGLRDQVALLSMGHLKALFSPDGISDIDLTTVSENGLVVYFRLQSLLSPELVGIVGRLLINHLAFIAGSLQRVEEKVERKLLPVYFDEFATFAGSGFSDLISKARSAGMALHFAHQSVGDLKAVSDAFLSQITDNSATKIVLRVNDPDSSEYFAKTFGTRIYEKFTKRMSNVQDSDKAEVQGEGSSREAHQFRASPDLIKNHPTGVGSILVSHGLDASQGASSVFRVRFPRLV